MKREVENCGFQMSCNHLKEVQDDLAYIISQHVVKFLGSRCLSLHQELLSKTHASERNRKFCAFINSTIPFQLLFEIPFQLHLELEANLLD